MNKYIIPFLGASILCTHTLAKELDTTENSKVRLATNLLIGSSSINSHHSPYMGIGLDTQRYYSNGLIWGLNVETGIQSKPILVVGESKSTMASLDINAKFGYSFGPQRLGFGLYGIVGYGYLYYSYLNSSSQEKQYARGLNYGIGSEYIFDSGLILTGSYILGERLPQSGEYFKSSKIIIGVGYSFNGKY